MRLHDMLKTIKVGMMKTCGLGSIAHVLAISYGGAKRKKSFHLKGKKKVKVGQSNQGLKIKVDSEIAPTSDLNEVIYFLLPVKGALET